MRKLAAASAAATGAVIVAMDWLPTTLNRNLEHTTPEDRLLSTAIHATMATAVAMAHLTGRRWLILGGAGWFSIVLVSAGLNWWVPYVVGSAPGEITSEAFAAEYADNLSVLPQIGDHPVVPDVQHMIIHALVLASCVTSWLSFRTTARPPTPFARTAPPDLRKETSCPSRSV